MPAAHKILINALSAQKGGGQTYLINLLAFPELRSDFKITLIVSPKNVNVFEHLEDIDFIISEFGGNNLFTRFLWENFYLPFLVKNRSIDALFSVSGIVPKFYFPQYCKLVTICQNMLPFCSEELSRIKSMKLKFKFYLIKYSQWVSFWRSDLIIFISNFGRKVITELPLLRSKNSVVIPHGIPDFFRQKNQQNNFKQIEEKYTLYVSSFFEYKAQMELVQAWNLLPLELRKERKLLLVGPEGSGYRRRVEEKIRQLQIQDEVKVVGELNYQDLPNYYRNAELLVFASSCENCPNILLECLASGVMTICSNFSPMSEFAQDAVIYVNPYNIEEFKEALERFYIGEIDNKKYITRALEISKKYTWESTSKDTWKFIKKVLC